MKEYMKKVPQICDWMRKHRIYSVLIVITILTNLFMLITFEYCDLDSMSAWTLNFWDILFEGRLDKFYEYTALNIHGAAHGNCAGNFLWLLPWCIWNFPLWLVHKFTGILLVTNFWSLCWSKLFLLVTEFLTAYFCGKICMFFSKDINKAILGFLLVIASPEIMMSVGYAGQDEIVYICLFVLALYCDLKEYRKRCYICMVCAVSFCPIMLVPVLVLILFQEKNIWKAMLKAGGTLIPLVLFEFLYRNDAVYQSVKGINDFGKMLNDMLEAFSIYTGSGLISISGVVLFFVFWHSYVTSIDDRFEMGKRVVLVETISFFVISFLMPNFFYRRFLYVPFLVIFILISEKDLKMNLFLLTILTYGRSFLACGDNEMQNMNTEYVMKNSWVTDLCNKVNSNRYLAENRVRLFHYFETEEFTPTLILIINAVVLGCALLIILINHRSKEKSRDYNVQFSNEASVFAYCICMPFILLMYFIMLL